MRANERTAVESMAVEIMVALFVLVEGAGSCFDVLVREAIERGERADSGRENA